MNPVALKVLPMILDSLLKTPVKHLKPEQVKTWLDAIPVQFKPGAESVVFESLVQIAQSLGLPSVGSIVASPAALGRLIPLILQWKDQIVEDAEVVHETIIRCANCGYHNPLINGERIDNLIETSPL